MLYLMVGAKTTIKDLQRVVAPVVKAYGIPHRIMRFHEGEPCLGQGDVLFIMGKAAFDEMSKHGVYPKNRSVTSLREKPQVRGAGHVLCSYDAAIGRTDPQKEAFLQIDIMQACRMHQTGTIKPILGSYHWREDFSIMIEEIKAQYAETGKPVRVAGDLETVGFDYVAKDRFIVSAQFSHREGYSDLVRFYSPDDQPKEGDKLHDQINWLLNSEMVIMCGANFKYDLNWIKYKWGIECTNFKLDTTLVGSLLNENRSNSLNTHAKLFTDLGGYDDDLNSEYDKGRMDLIPNDALLPYAGGDTDATLRVRNTFARELQQDPWLTNFYVNLLHPASRAFEKMEQNGVLVNGDKLRTLGEELEQEKNQYLREMFDMMPRPLALKYRGETRIKAAIVKDYLFGARGLGLKPIMFSEKNQEPLTNKSHLNNFDDPKLYPEAHKFIQLVNKWNQADKAQGTYCTGFLKHQREDGYFHPQYQLFRGAFDTDRGIDESGTVTGRLAAKNPAIQCMPGDQIIETDKGKLKLETIISRVILGAEIKVLTHTGEYRKVTDTYHNGTRKVLKIKTKSGREIKCTENHPVLVEGLGFVRADALRLGDRVYEQTENTHKTGISIWSLDYIGACFEGRRAKETSNYVSMPLRMWRNMQSRKIKTTYGSQTVLRLHEAPTESKARAQPQRSETNENLFKLAEHESPLQPGNMQGIQVLRGAGYFLRSTLGEVRELLSRYGRDARQHDVRPEGRERELQQGELSLRHKGNTIKQHAPQCIPNRRGFDANGYTMGTTSRAHTNYDKTASSVWGLDESRSPVYSEGWKEAEQAGFATSEIDSIEVSGVERTYDITVDRDHSFVANGIVVHNTLPKKTPLAKRLRACYEPPEGYSIVEIDFSQGELRVCAVMANEPAMKKAYREGLDLHVISGGATAGLSYEQMQELAKTDEALYKKYRNYGKPQNFGLLYGMSWGGFQQYAKDQYHVLLSDKEAQNMRFNFFDTYARLPDWHEETKEFARQNGYIRSPLGRVRHLPLINSYDNFFRSQAERQAVNSGVQSTLSDLLIYGMARFRAQYGDPDEVKFMAMIHDALVSYIKTDQLSYWIPIIQAIMQDTQILYDVFGWEVDIPFIADAEHSETNFAEMREYQEAA